MPPRGRKPIPAGLRILQGGPDEKPEADSGSKRKRRRSKEKCGYVKENGKACRRAAGWGTEHLGEGLCKDCEERAGPLKSSLPPYGMELWTKLEPIFKKHGLLTTLDYPAFAALCLSAGLAMEAAQRLMREGMTTMGTGGTVKKNPHLTAFNECMGQYRQWCAEFGLTPTSRMRLERGGDLPKDPLEELLRDSEASF